MTEEQQMELTFRPLLHSRGMYLPNYPASREQRIEQLAQPRALNPEKVLEVRGRGGGTWGEMDKGLGLSRA